jgi:Domain of unknown function (DUF5916)/Carbohydrate family 9 binding domain-like
MNNRRLLAAAACLFLASPIATNADAAESRVYSTEQLPRVLDTIKVDGVVDEALWQDALRIELDVETQPGENIAAPVKTTALIAENGNSLLVAFIASDPEPEKIRAYLRDRDSAFQDDFVGIVLDTFNDQRRGFEFFVNPLGVQMDLTNDDVNGNEDESWDAIWDSAGRITDTGYTVEMEIPLNQLRFPRRDGPQTWGFDVVRMYPRAHRYRLAAVAQDRALNCYLCQFQKLSGLEDVTPGRDLEVVPTLTAARSASREDPLTDPLINADPEADVGLSVRWGITPEMTANLAINPDFSQIEADVAQLDVNNQFALFFPETRPFFLEGADYFTTPIDAIFTRTVADPDLGAKLTGKRDNNTFGLFVADDRITNLLFPGAFGSDSESLAIDNQAVVARYSRSFGDQSSIGALLTGRRADDYRNLVTGVDGRWKINDQNSVHAQVLRSTTEYPEAVATEFEQPLGSFSGDAVSINYDYSSRNWFGYLRHEAFDPDFRADSGFVSRVNFSQQTVGLGHFWHGSESSWWKQLRLNGDWDITHDDQGRLLEREVEAYFAIKGPLQSFVEAGGLTRKVLFDDVLFQEDKISVYTEISPRSGLSLGFWLRFGDQIDFANTRLGDQIRMQPRVDWNVNRHLLFRLRSTLIRLDSKEGPNIFDARVFDARLTWQFNVRSFLRLTVQSQDVERNQDMYIDTVQARERNTGRQLLYSYKINPQTVFFLGYSDRLLDDDDLDHMTTTDRTLFMKIGYAWIP